MDSFEFRTAASFVSPGRDFAMRHRNRLGSWLAAGALTLAAASIADAAINANKSFLPDAVRVNVPSTVTFYFLNAHTSAATGLAFTDPLPAGMVIAPSPNASTTCGGSLAPVAGATQVVFSGGTIPAAAGNSPGSCQLSFDVVSSTPGVYVNSVPAGEVTSSQGPNSQDAEATLNVSALAPINGTKAFNPNFVHGYLTPTLGVNPPVGGVSIVTITLNNPNSVALTNVGFTDTLPGSPNGIVVSPVPNASTNCGGTLTATALTGSVTLAGGAIPPLGSCTVTFSVVAQNPLSAQNGTLTNTIGTNGVTSFENVGSASFSANITRQTGAQIVKTFSPTSITDGGTSVLQVQVRNYNVSTLTGIAFTDALPANLAIGSPAQPTFVSTDCQFATSTVASGFSYTGATGATSFSISGGSLVAAPNTANPTTCNVRVNIVGSNATAAPISRTNTIPGGTFGGGVAYASTNATLTINPNASVSLLGGSKSFTPTGPVFQGTTITATITLTKSGSGAATNVAFTDNLTTMGTGYTIAASPAPTTTDCGSNPTITAVAGSTSFSISSMTVNAGQSCVITFPIAIANNASTGTRTNTIPIGAITGTSQGNAITNGAALTASIVVNPVVTGSKAFSPSTVPIGTDSLLTVTVTQPAGAPAWTGFTVTDPLPSGHTVSPNNPPSGSPANACTGGFSPALAAGATSFSFTGSFPVGFTSCVVRVNVRVPNSGNATATNTIPAGNLTVTTGSGNFSNPSSITANITRTAGTVTLTKSFDPDVVPLNGLSTMFVRIVNNGPNSVNLTGVGLIDNLPAGLKLSATPNPQFTSDVGSGCTLGTLTAPANGTTVTLANATVNAGRICTIQVQTQATVAGNLINQIPAQALTSTQGITNLEAVAATVSSTGLADLAVTKTDGVATVNANGTTTYTVTVTNAAGAGFSDVAGAQFVDDEPPGVTFTSWSCVASAGSSCTANGAGSINDTVGIKAGGTLTYTINASIAAVACPTIANTATIVAPGTVVDTNPDNNAATDTDTCASGTIQLRKSWVNAKVGDTANLTATGIVNSATAALNSTADNPTETDIGTTATMYSGETATLAETLNVPANYTASLACTNGPTGPAVTVTNNTVTMPSTPISIVCTWTNTRVNRNLTLVKQWVNGAAGDQISVTTQSSGNNASVSSTSSGNNQTTGSAASVVPGTVVTLPAETFNVGSQSNYTTTVSCSGATLSGSTPGSTFTMPDNDVTCTYTNTRANRSLTLVKQWVNGKSGDQVTVTTTGLTNNATVSSTSSGNNQTTGSAVSNVPGATVTLPAETFNVGSQSNYTTTVSCSGATASSSTLPATFTMPDGNVVCTYTNTRVNRNLTLVKQWVNGKSGDQITVTTTGLTNNATVSSTSSGSNQTTGSSVSNVPGGTVTLPAETFNVGSQANYTTTVSCTGATASGSTPGSTFTMPDNDVTCTYTNTRVNRNLTLVKQWVNGAAGDQISVTTQSSGNNASVSSTSSGNNQTTGSAVSNVPGGTVTLPAETFNVGSQANYTTTVSCTGATASSGAPGPNTTFVMPDNDVTCTYTNTRANRSLTLVKQWVNGKSGDQVTVTTTGLADNATVSSTSSGNNQTTGSAVSNVPGATVTLPAETFNVGSQSNYTTTVSCSGATASSSTPGPNTTFTMPDGNVVCTYTNTRVNRNLTLVKQWVNGANGDQISVTTQSSGNNASVSSTSSGNNQATGSAVSVVPGTVVTLPAETFTPGGAASNYTVSVSCTGASASGPAPGATVTMPDADVTCTYTNTRRSATLQLRKTWTNAVVNDTASLSAAGLANSAAAGFVSTANLASETDNGPVVTVYAGEVATLAETVNSPTNATYSSNLVCTGNFNTVVGNQLTISGDDDGATIVCTWTNGRTPPPFPGGGANPVPVNGPAGLALLVAMLGLAGMARARRGRRV